MDGPFGSLLTCPPPLLSHAVHVNEFILESAALIEPQLGGCKSVAPLLRQKLDLLIRPTVTMVSVEFGAHISATLISAHTTGRRQSQRLFKSAPSNTALTHFGDLHVSEHGITTIRLRTFRLRHFVYRHFVYR